MKKKIYVTPNFEYTLVFEFDVLFASGGNDTLVDSKDIWDFGG